MYGNNVFQKFSLVAQQHHQISNKARRIATRHRTECTQIVFCVFAIPVFLLLVSVHPSLGGQILECPSVRPRGGRRTPPPPLLLLLLVASLLPLLLLAPAPSVTLTLTWH